jgi:hypothetical protein
MWPEFPYVPSDTITRREDFGLLLNLRGLLGTGVEIGTHRGEFAEQLLHRWRGERLVCVDPWQDNLPDYDDDVLNHQPREPDYQEALQRLAPYETRVDVIRKLSSEAAEEFPVGSIDFAYLDGNHAEAYLREDIAMWGYRLRSGGCLAGHDFNGDWQDQTRAALFDLLLGWRQPIFYLLGDAASWFTFKP